MVENGRLIELALSQKENPSIIGNIYSGIVKKINYKLAFIDIGLSSHAFLDTSAYPPPKAALKEGQQLAIRIMKDPIKNKGPVVDFADGIEPLTAPGLISGKPPIVKILLPMLLDIDEIVCDSEEDYSLILNHLGGRFTNPSEKILLHQTQEPIFERYFIQTQFEKAFEKHVWLKNGGLINIEQTSACVVIDVNSSRAIKGKSKRTATLKTNIVAAAEIAHQLRLRNLSGIIIIDFISMSDPDDIERLTQSLANELKKDRITCKIFGMTELGLMQLTRKRILPPILDYKPQFQNTNHLKDSPK